MRGIEAAFWGTLLHDLELKTSASGKKYCNFGCAVVTSNADNGKDVSQYVRVACFGEAAEVLAARVKKGDRVYCEGSLTQTQWNDRGTGEIKHGLNLAAWTCQRVANIGRNRERREHGEDSAPASQPSEAGNRISPAYCAGPGAPRKFDNGFNERGGDQLPF